MKFWGKKKLPARLECSKCGNADYMQFDLSEVENQIYAICLKCGEKQKWR